MRVRDGKWEWTPSLVRVESEGAGNSALFKKLIADEAMGAGSRLPNEKREERKKEWRRAPTHPPAPAPAPRTPGRRRRRRRRGHHCSALSSPFSEFKKSTRLTSQPLGKSVSFVGRRSRRRKCSQTLKAPLQNCSDTTRTQDGNKNSFIKSGLYFKKNG